MRTRAPNEDRPGRGLPLPPGTAIAIAIELMPIASGKEADATAGGGWTLRTPTAFGRPVEHTVAITDAGPRILTAREAHR